MTGIPILEPAEAYSLWAASYPAHAHNPVMQAEERAMLDLMPASFEGRTVLDAGCGSGRYLLHALRRGASRMIGVDLSPAMLARARLVLDEEAHGGKVVLREGSLTALPVADAWADIVLCGLVVGHLENLESALVELYRVCKPGGFVLCSDVHPIGHALGWLRDFKHEGKHYAARHTPHWYSCWHVACAAAGFSIERVQEPYLEPSDIRPNAHFDRRALELPVAFVLRLRRRC